MFSNVKNSFTKIMCMLVCVVVASSVFMLVPVKAENDISVYIDDKKVAFGENGPLNKNGRIIAPVKDVFLTVGANVDWEALNKKVIITYEGNTIELRLGTKIVKVIENGREKQFESDVFPEIINGSTYVPVAVVAESLGAGVIWKDTEKAVYLNFNAPLIATTSGEVKPFEMKIKGGTIKIGDTAASVKAVMGEHEGRNLSVYGYIWQDYVSDLDNFALIGVSSDEAVAFYSNSKKVTIAGIRPGMTAEQLNSAVGRVLPLENKSVITNDEGKLTIYRSSLEDYKVIGIMAQKVGHSVTPSSISEDFTIKSIESQLFAIINSERNKRELKLLAGDEKLNSAAKAHSNSMAQEGYYAHTDKNGKTPFDRLASAGVTSFEMAAESIAKGNIDAVETFSAWMNVKVDFANITAENYNYIGVGGAPGGNQKIYFTAEFIEK